MTNHPTILILDSEQILREATSLMLSNRGAKVSAVATLDEALVLLERHTFDVMVVDLPENAVNVAEIIRRMRVRGCLPQRVVACVCAPLTEAESAGVSEVIVKPFPFERLMESVFGANGSRRPTRSGVFPTYGRLKTVRRTGQVRRGRE